MRHDDVLTDAPARRRGRGAPSWIGAVAVRAALAVGTFTVFAFWWSGTPAAAVSAPGVAVVSGGQLAGLLASFLVCAQLLLVGRVRWFERACGHDRLVSWHRSLGTTVVLLVLLHVGAMILGGMLVERTTPWSELVALTTTTPDLPIAIVGTALFLVVGMSSGRIVRARLSYEWWFALHLTIYVGIYLAFWHQLSAGTHMVAAPGARAAWIALYVGTAAALLWSRALGPVIRHVHLGLRVDSVHVESPDTVSVWLRGTGVHRLRARAGQFFLVRFLTREHAFTAHPYSISIVPTSEHVRFTIGALGDHSAQVRHLQPGTRVFLEGPFGRFTTQRARGRRILLVAGGAGIGPVRALAEDFVAEGDDVVVVHRAHTREDLALAAEFPRCDELRYVPVHGRRADLGYDPLAPGTLATIVPDIAAREVFVCGPPGMTETVVRSSLALGVPRRTIHHEELSLS
jgi:predicted ferric reductase